MSLSFFTSAEVADLLRLNQQVVQRKLQAGEIPAYRIGREWRVERAQLLTWLEGQSNQRGLTREQKVIETFVGPDGRLRSIPTQPSRREIIVRHLASSFEPNRTYAEREVNEILRRHHDDVAWLRREMVGLKVLVRTPAGIYKLRAP